MRRRQFITASAASAAALSAGWRGTAQARGQTISLVLGVGPGTGADAGTRVLAEELTGSLQRTVVVDNKPGAEGMISINHVLNGPADGSRVVFTSPSMLILPLINKQMNFNALTHLQPITTTVRGGSAVVVRPGIYKNLDELAAAARKEPGKIALATYGGHYYKLLALMIERELGVQFNKVPYKDPAPAMNDLVGGNVHVMLIDAGAAREWHRTNKIRAIALTHETRPPSFEDVPTFKEMGHPDLVSYIWTGFAVKAGTSPEITQAYYKAFSDGFRSKAYQDYLSRSASGSELIGYDPQRTRQYWEAESKRFAKLIEETGYTT